MKTFRYFLLIIAFTRVPDCFSQNYRLIIRPADKDTPIDATTAETLKLKSSFLSREAAVMYIRTLPDLLISKGFPAASVDTVIYDTSAAIATVYFGQQYHWADINTDSVDKKILSTAWKSKRMNITELRHQQESILDLYENNGYPFAAVKLDNVSLDNDTIRGTLSVNKGPYYVIDSIRVYGKIKIKNIFLQRYLGIENGSAYNKSKLQTISNKLLQLPYLQEQQHWDMNMLGSGAVINLYLQQRRSSQVNFLVGFLPSGSQTGKLQVTADVDLNLKNALGSGETILLNWKQFQRQSPRLNLGYQHPYIFRSRFGIDAGFDLLKRDSAFLQIDATAGLLYNVSAGRMARIFFQNQRTYLLSGGYDTNIIKITKRLPENIDINANSLGISYEWMNTNYIFNPRKGNEVRVLSSAGLKRISRNNDIVNLHDPSNPTFNFNRLYDTLKSRTYQFRAVLYGAHYFPAGKRSTFKTGLNAGIFQSEDIFRNELFRIGGYKLLRGFDEESIFASQYAVFTAEYRYLTGLNSFLFVFADGGLTKTRLLSSRLNNNFISGGLGISAETGFGILNVSYAVGKRNDVKFDLRGSSKIHVGYINYF